MQDRVEEIIIYCIYRLEDNEAQAKGAFVCTELDMVWDFQKKEKGDIAGTLLS